MFVSKPDPPGDFRNASQARPRLVRVHHDAQLVDHGNVDALDIAGSCDTRFRWRHVRHLDRNIAVDTDWGWTESP